MKNILIVLSLLSTSFFALSAHHEEDETATKVQENNFAYLSSYTMPAGSNADRMADSLKRMLILSKKADTTLVGCCVISLVEIARFIPTVFSIVGSNLLRSMTVTSQLLERLDSFTGIIVIT